VEFGGETKFIQSQEDWDWAKALARISGLLNSDGHISDEHEHATDTSNPHQSAAYLGSMYDVHRFNEDMVTLCNEESGPTPYTPPTASNPNIHKPTNTDLGDDRYRYFNWTAVFIQCAKFEHTSAMIHKLEQMIKMFAKCGITGLSIWSDVGNSPVFNGKKEVSSRFVITQENPLKNAARWLEISFPYCCAKQIRTELFVAYGLFWAYVNAQRHAVAKIAWTKQKQMLMHVGKLKKGCALQSAQALFEKNHPLISKHSLPSLNQFKTYCDKNGVHNFRTPRNGGVTPFLRDSRAREFFNNGGVREVGETYRKHTYATTQAGTALPLYFTRIAKIVNRDMVENCMVFSDLPDGRGLQCDGVLVFKD
ncbi:hypothetical protein GGI24_003722, partial [Coemansia furcata]